MGFDIKPLNMMGILVDLVFANFYRRVRDERRGAPGNYEMWLGYRRAMSLSSLPILRIFSAGLHFGLPSLELLDPT